MLVLQKFHDLRDMECEFQIRDRFEKTLTESGGIGREGNITDASFVEVPCQHNNRRQSARPTGFKRNGG